MDKQIIKDVCDHTYCIETILFIIEPNVKKFMYPCVLIIEVAL